MATVDTHTAAEAEGHEGGSVYDGFISYSHAADDLLAPRLQAGLQRFAKPWWKRRALRIFRDESSLSANPHLWSSITDALDTSDWFVLLLSPDAADSEWVNQEVQYWVEHKDPERVIPVLTDGEFRWAETDIDLESTAAPPALYGVFSDEPRWVDLRFARSEEQLDLNNPRFSAAVADIASAIRGVPKDELESEEVRQHRRTVRTAWAAAAGLLVLALVAAGAALFALDQRNDAQAAAEGEAEQRQLAEANAEAEAEARAEAESNAAEAKRQEAVAEQQAAIAEARELAARAENVLEDDPELSAYLAIAALGPLRAAGVDTADAESVLRTAIATNRVILRIPGGDFVAVHPDGSLLATSDGDGVAVWSIPDEEIVERYARNGAKAIDAAFSPDGTLLAVSFAESAPAVTVWNRASNESYDLGPMSRNSADRLTFSPDGSLIAFASFTGPFGTDQDPTEVWSVGDAIVIHEGLGWGADFSVDGMLSFAVADRDGATTIEVFDPGSGTTVATIPLDNEALFTSWSPTADRIAVADRFTAVVLDVKTHDPVSRTNVERVFRPEWLESGDAFFVGGTSVPRVIDAATGEVRMELPGQVGGTFSYDVVPGTESIASAGFRTSPGGTVIFDTSATAAAEIAAWDAELETNSYARFIGDGTSVFLTDGDSYLTANAVDGSESRLVSGGSSTPWYTNVDENAQFVAYNTPDGPWVVRSLETGADIYVAPDGWSIRGVSPNGAYGVIKQAASLDCAPVQLVAIADGQSSDLPITCIGDAWFSPDAELMVAGNAGPDAEAVVFDTETGEIVVDFSGTPYGGLSGAFTSDGRKMVLGSLDGPVFVLDVATLLTEGPVPEAVDLELPAHDYIVIVVRVSADDSVLATASFGGPLKVWDLANDGRLLGEFGGEFSNIGDFHPTEPYLLVASSPNHVRIYTFDTDELIEIARERFTRTMTDAECQQFFRGPCPAL